MIVEGVEGVGAPKDVDVDVAHRSHHHREHRGERYAASGVGSQRHSISDRWH